MTQIVIVTDVVNGLKSTVNGTPIEYSVGDPKEPSMTEKEKENVAKIIIASMAKE